jgi:uncharacterized membrane protein
MANIRTKYLLYLLMSFLGFVDAFYLSWVKIQHTELFCGGSTNCATVNSSSYAYLFGIPIALLGLLTYLVIIIILIMGKQKVYNEDFVVFALFGITLIGVIFSAYLTYVEIYVIHAICPYCMVSAIIMLILFVMAISDLKKLMME